MTSAARIAAIALSVLPALAALQPAAAQSPAVNLNGVWTSVTPPGTGGRWAIDTFSEKLPALTAWGKARFDASKPQRGPRGVAVSETDDLVYQCFPPGVPRIYLHPFPFEIVQSPSRVLMVFEYDHLVRQIFTDGRKHRDDLPPSWMGDSVGKWDGGTLVVETVGFNDRTWIDRIAVPHSEEMRLIERMHMNGNGYLQIDMRVEDPKALAEPWEFTRYFKKTDWTIDELICKDNANFDEFESTVTGFK
ncbi:MAG: hypothetical protein ACM37U_06580 [Gemmatimonas sp.]